MQSKGRLSKAFVVGVLATALNVVACFFGDFGIAGESAAFSMALMLARIVVLLLVAYASYTRGVREPVLFWSMLACFSVYLVLRGVALLGSLGFALRAVSYVASGAAAALSLPLLGSMLSSFGRKEARRVIVVGFMLAVVLDLVGEAASCVDDGWVQSACFLLFLVVSSVHYFRMLSSGETPSSSDEAVAFERKRIQSNMSSLLLSMGVAPMAAYAASALLSLVFGLFEAKYLLGGQVYGSGTLVLAFALICCCIPSLFIASERTRRFLDGLLLAVFVLSIAILPVFLVFPELEQLLFSVLLAGIVFLQVPIWIFLVDVSVERGASPAYLFGAYPAVLSLFHAVGRLASWLLLPSMGAGEQYLYLVVGTLTLVALAASVAVAMVLRRESKKGERPADDEGPLQGRSFDAFCDRFGLTDREREIVRLYAGGRSAPFIASQLHLATSTVKTHIGNVYAKTGVHTKQDLLNILDGLERKTL